ncbi:MAG TPA: UvrD-helicase domain-containing protein [Vicinamibacterales bacterium]|nr:UvrD-helicase domain-containing protein [Vicinamibacterales bacterium]
MPRSSRTSTPRLPFEDPAAPAASDVPDAADRAAAVDPTRNVVLEASAGTGKTRVLVDRYTNLLKARVDPANILAITFTRKAAAEMRERILQNLQSAAATGEIDATRWRDLRDRLGDIAISTIDAFCLSLLREFPLEADLDPGFTMADDTEVLRLAGEGLDRALRVCRGIAAADPAVALLFAQLGEPKLRAGLAVLLDRRLVAHDALRRFLVHGPGDVNPDVVCVRAAARLADTLRSVEGGLAAFLADGPRFHPRFAMLARDIETLAPALAPGGPAGSAEGAKLASRMRLIADGLRDHFLNDKGEPRTRWPYKASDADTPEAWKRHRDRAQRLAPAMAADLARFSRDLNVVLSHAVWRVFEIALSEYRRTLAAHAVVDFPDALWRTLDLLAQMDEFAQSRYLLQARYHHLLVDEFQDTSQAQWELVWRLVQAWGEGLGMEQDAPLPPSIFIVGDRKQSIYGFRDADVGVLGRAVISIAGLRQEGSVRRAIRKSFRAVPPLLAFANDLFDAVEKQARPDAFAYGESDRFPVGAVTAAPEPVLGFVVGTDAALCAERVASEVDRLLTSGQVRDKATGLARAIRPGDIGILFRSREGHQAFESALEARGIGSYVYKGLGFFEADEIKDVFALLRYLADPDSDLRASAFLRSRFVRLSDPALQRLAPRLAGALRDTIPPDVALGMEDAAVLARARDACAVWLPLVDCIPPAELLDRILEDSAYAFETAGARARQAGENLKKVRALVRRIQNRGYATVGRVAEHLDRLSVGDESNAVIDAVDAVNLMTVHAAKGLEFPAIFLVNVGKGAGGSRSPIRLVADGGGGQPSVSIGDYLSDADADLAEREREETKRLLYVAITRARDRLYLSGVVAGGRFNRARGSLAEILPASLTDLLTGAADDGGPDTLEWSGNTGKHVFAVCRAITPVRSVASSPDFTVGGSDFGVIGDLPADVRLSASTAGGRPPCDPTGVTVGSTHESARLVGTLVHRLFEQHGLPAAADRDQLADLLLSLVHPRERADVADMDGVIREAAARIDAISRRPVVTGLFLSGERLHEVPFAFRRHGELVHGTIDTLVRGKGVVTVVEVKTGRRAPAHEHQLALYIEAARALFPPPDQVDGVLVYPDDELWLTSS